MIEVPENLVDLTASGQDQFLDQVGVLMEGERFEKIVFHAAFPSTLLKKGETIPTVYGKDHAFAVHFRDDSPALEHMITRRLAGYTAVYAVPPGPATEHLTGLPDARIRAAVRRLAAPPRTRFVDADTEPLATEYLTPGGFMGVYYRLDDATGARAFYLAAETHGDQAAQRCYARRVREKLRSGGGVVPATLASLADSPEYRETERLSACNVCALLARMALELGLAPHLPDLAPVPLKTGDPAALVRHRLTPTALARSNALRDDVLYNNVTCVTETPLAPVVLGNPLNGLALFPRPPKASDAFPLRLPHYADRLLRVSHRMEERLRDCYTGPGGDHYRFRYVLTDEGLDYMLSFYRGQKTLAYTVLNPVVVIE